MKVFILLAFILIIGVLIYFLLKCGEENDKIIGANKDLREENSRFCALVNHLSSESSNAYYDVLDAIAKLNILDLHGEDRVQITAALLKLNDAKEILENNKKYNVKYNG